MMPTMPGLVCLVHRQGKDACVVICYAVKKMRSKFLQQTRHRLMTLSIRRLRRIFFLEKTQKKNLRRVECVVSLRSKNRCYVRGRMTKWEGFSYRHRGGILGFDSLQPLANRNFFASKQQKRMFLLRYS